MIVHGDEIYFGEPEGDKPGRNNGEIKARCFHPEIRKGGVCRAIAQFLSIASGILFKPFFIRFFVCIQKSSLMLEWIFFCKKRPQSGITVS
jgi:hypothetical protein